LKLKKVLDFFPESVKEVKLRSDTAGYQYDLLKQVIKQIISVLERLNLQLAAT